MEVYLLVQDKTMTFSKYLKNTYSISSLDELTREILYEAIITPNIKISRTGCWIWQKPLTNSGYAIFRLFDTSYLLHRLVLTFRNFKEPNVTDHLCRNRACLNELHLEDVSYSINNKRRYISTSQTHCKRGHEYTKETLIVYNGYRNCRICRDNSYRKRYHLQQALRIGKT